MRRVMLLALSSMYVFAAGCAAPITYYTRTQNSPTEGKVNFVSEGGPYTTIALYEDARTCKGIQRLAFFKPGMDDTVFVKHSRYLTFSMYIQFPGVTKFLHSTNMFSVPFESGDLRVSVSYDKSSSFTKIERRQLGGDWVLVKDAIKRQGKVPFFESGDWCEPVTEIQ